METIRVIADVSADGSIHIDASTRLPPGRAEIVMVVNPAVEPSQDAAILRLSLRNIPPHCSGAMHGDWTRATLLDEMRGR